MLSQYTPAQLQALKTEFQTDPVGIGYAAPLALGAMNQLATLINATTGSGVATVTLPSMSNAAFVEALLPYVVNIANLAAAKQQLYVSIIWPAILQMPTIDFTNANVQGFLAQAVADGLLTQAQATAINQRPGTRAEVVLGAGAAPTWQDCSVALGLAQAQAARDAAKRKALGMGPTQHGMEEIEKRARLAGTYHGEHY